jgi:adenylate cyclase
MSPLSVLSTPAGAAELPKRVKDLIRAQEAASERLIGWAQLGLVAIFGALYLVAPRPADAGMAMLAPVPIALTGYLAFTLLRLRLAYRDALTGWLLILSILVDIVLLLGLIWSFHVQYGQPLAFSLKVPTFIYIFVFIALRALRFDHRYVLAAGAFAALGWLAVVGLAIGGSSADAITRNFVAYLTSNRILIGAEIDKVVTILMVTGLLTIAARRAQHTLVTAVREETGGREIRRFLSGGVAEAITRAETEVEAGQAAGRHAAIMMLDIRGFTRFSTSVPPAEVVRMLTGFHARAVPLIRRHGGVVDKFLGDGVMATFGAVTPSPTAAADALRALDAIMAEALAWRADLTGMGLAMPLEVNGSVAAGPVVFATIGDAERLEYTVIGEAANLAAKLEKHNKAEGTRALTTWQTYELACVQGYVAAPAPERRLSSKVAGAAEPVDLAVMAAA